MAQLRLTGLIKSYGSVHALRGVDLEIEDGEFFVLFGPSAAGKTTTLRIIAGLERPDGGTLTVDGHDLTGVRSSAATWRWCSRASPSTPTSQPFRTSPIRYAR